MNRPLSSLRLLFAAVFFVAAMLPAVAAADLKIVATVGDFAAVADQVVEDDGEVVQLVRSGEDPHFVDPRPSFARHLSDADLVMYVGLELEVGWLPTLITRARNSAIQQGQPGHFDASRHIQPQEVPTGPIDRSMGDVHPGGNPHYNKDPRQMARVALALGRALGEVEPAMADEFEKRSRDVARDLIRFAQKWEQKFAEIPDEARRIIGYHNAWAYVDNWLGIEVAGEIEPKPGVPPNPRHVSNLMSTIEQQGVGVIIQLEYYPTSTAEQIADRADHSVEVLSVPAQARDGEEYLEHLEQNIIRPLYDALQRASGEAS